MIQCRVDYHNALVSFGFTDAILIYFMWCSLCEIDCSYVFTYVWVQIGPLRVWPGGLCLSRSIGDTDVGEFIVPVPHVKQIKVSVF